MRRADSGRASASLSSPYFSVRLAKLFQALPLVEDGGVEHFGLTPPEIAVTCGSHGGEPLHVAVVASLLAKAGLTPEALRCGAHPPMHAPSAAELYRQGTPPGRIHNNCSGKHAGMLALAQLHGWPLEDYLEPDHPVQRRMLESVAAWTGIAPSGFLMGGDGCGVPRLPRPCPCSPSGSPDGWRRRSGGAATEWRERPAASFKPLRLLRNSWPEPVGSAPRSWRAARPTGGQAGGRGSVRCRPRPKRRGAGACPQGLGRGLARRGGRTGLGPRRPRSHA
jgi:hypothetical protein